MEGGGGGGLAKIIFQLGTIPQNDHQMFLYKCAKFYADTTKMNNSSIMLSYATLNDVDKWISRVIYSSHSKHKFKKYVNL